MNRKTIFTATMLAMTSALFSQQDAQFSMNMFNQLSFNPAYAGMNQAICGIGLYRTQWVNFPGQPKTGLISINYYNEEYERILGGAGLTIVSDVLGAENNLITKLAYSYHATFQTFTVGLGLEGGMLQKSFNANWIAPDGTDGRTDVAIPRNESNITYDIGGGIYIKSDRLYLGISTTHVPENDFAKFSYKNVRHYYIMTAWQIKNLFRTAVLEPSLLIKTDVASVQTDFNLRSMFTNGTWIGASYRLQDAVVLMAGFTIRTSLTLGYAYDITLSNIKRYSANTHEIMIKYCLQKPTYKSTHGNVRMLQ